MKGKFLICVLSIASFTTLAGKPECKSHLSTLQNIQSLQRQGQSLKRSNSLKVREEKARKKWWQCEKGKGLAKKTKRKTKNKLVNAKAKKKAIKNLRTTSKAIVFSQQQPLIMKGRYQGSKQNDWLKFYVQPEKCSRPKTTKVFAFCMEDREQQQVKFEKEYRG